MGKRSDYGRVQQDLYETPAQVVAPLLPWLEPATRFVEPCAGRGLLAGHLKRAGHALVAAHDLPDDARTKRYDALKDEDVIAITNPPYWGQPENLHPLIVNVSDQAPFWALLQHDWLANVGSGELRSRARRVVVVGRVKFIRDSPSSGMDNVVWVKFTRPSDEPTVFVFREPLANKRPKTNAPKRAKLSAP
jgi:hypothetical protein